MSAFKLALTFLTLILSSNGRAYFFDYLKFQHAGEIGELAVGLGKQFTSYYSLDFVHGVVRESVGGKRIETIALKNNFDLHDFEYREFELSMYLGVSLYHVTDVHYRAADLNAYPSGYYSLGSVRGLFYGGAKVRHMQRSHHQFFVESGINDVWIINYFNSPTVINPFDYFSIAFGYTYLFE